LLNNWFRRDSGRQRFFFHDPLAMAVALDPNIVNAQGTQMAVETGDPVRLGESRISGRSGPVAVARQVDQDGFFKLFEELMGPEQGASDREDPHQDGQERASQGPVEEQASSAC